MEKKEMCVIKCKYCKKEWPDKLWFRQSMINQVIYFYDGFDDCCCIECHNTGCDYQAVLELGKENKK